MVDADTASSGGMIALLPDDPDALAIAHPRADPPEELHCTLAFLGSDVTGYDVVRRAQVVAAARDAAAALPGPVAAHVAGHATFNPTGGPDGDRDPCGVYLIGDAPGLLGLREDLHARLRSALGADFRDQFDPPIFHLTAGYGPTAEDLSYAGPVTFSRLLVVLAGERTTLPLPAPVLAATERDHTGHGHPPARLAILAARTAAWKANRTELRRAVAAFTSSAPAGLIREAIDPTAPRTRRKAQAGLAIATALHTSGHADAWIAANKTCRARAWETGARAGAHELTDGALPIARAAAGEAAPRVGEKRRLGGILAIAAAAAAALLAAAIARHRGQTATEPPQGDLDTQIDGLAGDVADLYTKARAVAAAAAGDDDSGGVTDEDIADALDDAEGVDAFADMAWGQAFLDGAAAVYADAGAWQVNWVCCLPGCPTCQDAMDSGPYPVDAAPGPQHPHCEDWLEPIDPGLGDGGLSDVA